MRRKTSVRGNILPIAEFLDGGYEFREKEASGEIALKLVFSTRSVSFWTIIV